MPRTLFFEIILTVKTPMLKQSKKRKNVVLAGILNCRSGSNSEITSLPAYLNSALELSSEENAVVQISKNAKGSVVVSPVNADNVFANSTKLASSTMVGEILTLSCGENLCYVSAETDMLKRFFGINISDWQLFYIESGRIEGSFAFDGIKDFVQQQGLSGDGLAFCPSNFDVGFSFGSVFGGSSDSDINAVPMLAASANALVCPLCWLKFDIGDAMSIATHESLRGDSVLGPAEMQRFLPTSFNEDGVALDAAGIPSPDVACPHCRKRLPQNYFEYKQQILSIVGAPSAGKSYYLSVLIDKLQESLFKNSKIQLKDIDPSGNMIITQMKSKLFSAKSPDEAILPKTAFEGAMYERYPRFGKMVSLPKPITYSLEKEGQDKVAMVLYDNAGEHFEPGLDVEQSPGAMHVASSSGILFLFDPAANKDFKLRLADYPDPQLSITGRVDYQESILAEMDIRIKRIQAMEHSKKLSTPLAVIIGKSDMWTHLLESPLPELLDNGVLDIDAVDKASDILRNFLQEISPNIVIQAEMISSDVKYFAASPLGHSPQVIESGANAGKIAPIPEKINPQNVEVPVMWLLSKCTKLIDKK